MAVQTVTKVAGAGANDNAVGTFGWANTNNIINDDNTTHALAQFSFAATSNYLKATHFGFAIPDTATILGITLEIQRYRATSSTVTDSAVRLLKADTVQATNKASATTWPTAEGAATYGGTADLWGTTWTPAQINAANFGAVLSVTLAGATSAYVDTMKITVTYDDNISAFTPKVIVY